MHIRLPIGIFIRQAEKVLLIFWLQLFSGTFPTHQNYLFMSGVVDQAGSLEIYLRGCPLAQKSMALTIIQRL
jgi:hypothetical protein